MKKPALLAWLGAIFGSLGALLCLGALALVWIFSLQLRTSVDHVFSRVSSILTLVGEGSEEFTAGVESSREAVDDLDRRIETEIENLAENIDLNPGELDELTTRARRIALRFQDWRSTANSAREFSELSAEILRSTSIFFHSDDRTMDDTREALENGRQKIEEAIVAFDELTTQLEALRQSRKQEAYIENIKPLFTRIDTALALIQGHSRTFTTAVTDFEETSADLGKKIKRRIFFGTALVSLLIVWAGAGQICLARKGCSRIRSPRK